MVIAEVLEATRKAVAGDKRTEKWNWRREKQTLSRMCRDFIVKNRSSPTYYRTSQHLKPRPRRRRLAPIGLANCPA
jgi:hypothetical protein